MPRGIVCLGASAGGLRSLEAIMRALPPDFPWPVLVTQHFSPEHASHLAEILGRDTSLPVREATDGEPLVPGVVFTSPSEREMGVTPDGKITLRPPVAGRPQRIDHLFATASISAGAMAIAVVLSGTGSDGAAGTLIVKLNGGTVIAESADSAEHSGMPAAAIRAGTVDAVLPRAEIGSLITQLAEGGLEGSASNIERGINEILELLAKDDGPDFRHYRLGPIRRRIRKRMVIDGSPDLDTYYASLARDPGARVMLAQSLLIAVTEFFRDPEAWDALRVDVIPHLKSRVARGERVRVWCAGAATGEEAYSLALLLAEELGDTKAENVSILATDIDERALEVARAGVYGPITMRSVDVARRARFFVPVGPDFRVTPQLRGLVEFARMDLTRDAAPGKFDLIVCRNVLIYFDEELQAQTVTLFHEALNHSGFLFLGRSEAILKHHLLFEPITNKMRIFRSRGDPESGPHAPAPDLDRVSPSGGKEHARALGDVIMDSTSIVMLVVDDKGRILVANRQARRLLGSPAVHAHLTDLFPGPTGESLLAAARSTLLTGRREAVSSALLDDSRGGRLDFSIEPFTGPERAVVLLGHAARADAGTAPLITSAATEDAMDLVTTNEELQSANEELAATNEELQAANEELAALNEEFRSTNETLGTSYDDLEGQALDIRAASALLRSIIHDSPDAMIACDEARRVIVCNVRARETFHLREDVVGRDVTKLGLAVPDLGSLLTRASGTREPVTLAHPIDGKPATLRVQHLMGPTGRSSGWALTWRLR